MEGRIQCVRFCKVVSISDDTDADRIKIRLVPEDTSKNIEDIEYAETIKFPATGNDGYRCKITFADGNTCEVDLFPSKALVFYNNLKSKMREETLEFFKNTLNV